MVRLFETHNRDIFELIAISLSEADKSAFGQRVKTSFDHFIDVSGKDDFTTAMIMRDIGVDIAIDREVFANRARPAIFSFRPAPISVSYLGFPGTSGSNHIDYIIGDDTVLPEHHASCYSEKIIRLPDSYQVNDGTRVIPDDTPTRADVGLPKSGFVFCCFNNNYKISPFVFDAWMRLLLNIDGSVLWLFEGSPAVRSNLAREASRRGVAPDRLIYAPRMPHAEHLARHRLADLFLDTLPYNAHTTASDALWAGVPVLTCLGTTFAGRVAASLLKAVGLPELVTENLADYQAAAWKLATTPGLLNEIKSRLSRNRHTHPLFDTERFRRHYESALVTIFERHRNGLPPEGFSVEAIPEQRRQS